MRETKILNQQKISDEINWGIPQWFISDDHIVLSTGENNETSFTGTCLPCKPHPYGKYTKNWHKELFKPLTENLTIVIGN